MSKVVILYAVWCLMLTVGALAAAWYGWSPYADSDGHVHTSPIGGHGGGVFYGPMHK